MHCYDLYVHSTHLNVSVICYAFFWQAKVNIWMLYYQLCHLKVCSGFLYSLYIYIYIDITLSCVICIAVDVIVVDNLV